MAITNIKISMDSKLKKEFEEFCDDVGMDTNTAFNIYANKVVNEWQIPFKIGYEIPNEETRKAIKEVEELKKSSNMKTYDSFDEMLKDLNKDDD